MAYANRVCCHPQRKALAQHYYINKTHAPENVNYLPPAPLVGPVLDGQIGINLGRMGAGVEVTPCHSTPKRERRLLNGENGAAGRLDCSPITLYTVLHKRQKALMKTSGGFRSEADTQKMSSPPFPSYPSAGPHNSEEPSCGNVIVWWRWSKQCDRML